MADYPEKLLQCVSDSVLEVLHSIGFPSPAELDPRDLAHPAGVEIFSASLGFSSNSMRGAVVLLASAAMLTATNPQHEIVKEFLEADHSDWIGELANQIVGALKRRTAGYKTNLMLSTPIVVRGSALSLCTGRGPSNAIFWFNVANHDFEVDFTAKLAAGLTFEGEPEETQQAAGGDALLF